MGDAASRDGPRIIKRYANRKLYDTVERRFTTLDAIRRLVRDGVSVVVQDHATGADRTQEVLAHALRPRRPASQTAPARTSGESAEEPAGPAGPASAAELRALRAQVDALSRTLDDLIRRTTQGGPSSATPEPPPAADRR